MRIPKTATIRKNIYGYAYKARMIMVTNPDKSYSLWDIPAGYYTHKNINMDTVVRVVVDELHMIASSKAREAVKVSPKLVSYSA